MLTKRGKKTTVEEWLNNVDVESLQVRDGKHLRRIGMALTALEAAESELTNAIAAAREAGDSWGMIGMVLGTSKQAAHRRFGRHPANES
jgi:hypothetical protein